MLGVRQPMSNGHHDLNDESPLETWTGAVAATTRGRRGVQGSGSQLPAPRSPKGGGAKASLHVTSCHFLFRTLSSPSNDDNDGEIRGRRDPSLCRPCQVPGTTQYLINAGFVLGGHQPWGALIPLVFHPSEDLMSRTDNNNNTQVPISIERKIYLQFFLFSVTKSRPPAL